jgi:hypothetical protein
MDSRSRKRIQTALARCDLERVISQYLRDGVPVETMTAELLDICVNLRELANNEVLQSSGARRVAEARERGELLRLDPRPSSDGGMSVRSLKPVP